MVPATGKAPTCKGAGGFVFEMDPEQKISETILTAALFSLFTILKFTKLFTL
jgi:hypothetical protein